MCIYMYLYNIYAMNEKELSRLSRSTLSVSGSHILGSVAPSLAFFHHSRTTCVL